MHSLHEADLPSTVEHIGKEAFYDTRLDAINIPKSVKYIGNYAFCYTWAKSLSVDPNPELVLGRSAFSSNPNFTKVTFFPVKDSKGGIFAGCGNLTEVEIPETITKLYREDLYDCDDLMSVTIPYTVMEIEDMALGYEYWDPEGDFVISGFTIRGTEGSAAEEYANANDITFEGI
jgi:hypothetical protein